MTSSPPIPLLSYDPAWELRWDRVEQQVQAVRNTEWPDLVRWHEEATQADGQAHV